MRRLKFLTFFFYEPYYIPMNFKTIEMSFFFYFCIILIEEIIFFNLDTVPDYLRKTPPLSIDTHAAVMTTEPLPWCHRMTVSSIISADSTLFFDWPGALMRFHGAGHNGPYQCFCVCQTSRDGQSVQPHCKYTQALYKAHRTN